MSRPTRTFAVTGDYPVREVVHLRVGRDLEYAQNAAVYVLMMHLAPDPALARRVASIARSEDSA